MPLKRKFMCGGLLGAAFSALLLAPLPTFAQSQKLPSFAIIQNQDRTCRPGADYDTITERGWMDMGVYEDFPPYASLVDGKPHGVDVDLAHLIAKEIGVEAVSYTHLTLPTKA